MNPLALFLKPLSPAERLAAEGEAAQGAGRGRGVQAQLRSALVRLCARWGARAAPRTSLLLTQPLQALLVGHRSRVSVADKWVRKGCFSD